MHSVYTITAMAYFDKPTARNTGDLNVYFPSKSVHTCIYMTDVVSASESDARRRFREDHLYPGAVRVKILTVQRKARYDARRYKEACIAAGAIGQ